MWANVIVGSTPMLAVPPRGGVAQRFAPRHSFTDGESPGLTFGALHAAPVRARACSWNCSGVRCRAANAGALGCGRRARPRAATVPRPAMRTASHSGTRGAVLGVRRCEASLRDDAELPLGRELVPRPGEAGLRPNARQMAFTCFPAPPGGCSLLLNIGHSIAATGITKQSLAHSGQSVR